VEYIILGLLIYKPMTIYEISSCFKEGLSLIYSASYGSIQNGIKKLLKNDCITFSETVENGRNKKIYTLNETGKAKFFKWMLDEVQTNKLESNFLVKIYFLGLIENKDEKLQIIEDILNKAQDATEEIQNLETALHNELDPISKEHAQYQLKTLSYGVMSHRASLNWIKDLYEDIKNETPLQEPHQKT